MSESYGANLGGGCAGGKCRSMRDVVARPTIYSGQQPGSGTAMKGPSQYYSNTGMSPAASFNVPQPPPVNAATSFYGYPQTSMYSGRPTGAACACSGGTPPAVATANSATNQQPFEAIGLLVCAKCFAENHRLDQGDVRDANGQVIEEGCAKTCVARGSPVGVFNKSNGRVTLMLTQSPSIAPLMLNGTTVRVRGVTSGGDVAQNGAVLVESVDTAMPGKDANSTNWVTVLVRPKSEK